MDDTVGTYGVPERQPSVPLDLISAIHDVRRRLQLMAPLPLSEDEEVDLILSSMCGLDSLNCCNELGLAKQLKHSILSHIPYDQSRHTVEDSSGENIVKGLRGNTNKKGSLESIRRQMIREIQASINVTLIADDANRSSPPINWLWHSGVAKSTVKKQKASGAYLSFNFDDIPMFEPLEKTLVFLRKPYPANMAALSGLLEIDTNELIEHPQWKELVELLFKSLTSVQNLLEDVTTSSKKINVVKVLQVHVRFMHGLQGQQCIDVASNLITFFWEQYFSKGSQSKLDQHDPFFTSKEGVFTSIFIDLVETALPQLQFCDDKTSDHFTITLFILLGNAGIPSHEQVTRHDLVDVLLCGRSANALVKLADSRPIAIAVHAIQSRFMEKLLRKMILNSQNFEASTQTDSLPSFIYFSEIFLSLLKPLVKMPNLLESVCSSNVDSAFLWTPSQCVSPITSAPSGFTNKLLSQIQSTESLLGLIQIGDAGSCASSSHLKVLNLCVSVINIFLQHDLFCRYHFEPVLQNVVSLVLLHVAEFNVEVRGCIVKSLLDMMQKSRSTTDLLLPGVVNALQLFTIPSSLIDNSDSNSESPITIWIVVTELTLQTNSALLSMVLSSWAVLLQDLICFEYSERRPSILFYAGLTDLLSHLASFCLEIHPFPSDVSANGYYSAIFFLTSMANNDRLITDLLNKGFGERLYEHFMKALLESCVDGSWDSANFSLLTSAIVMLTVQLGFSTLISSEATNQYVSALRKELVDANVNYASHENCGEHGFALSQLLFSLSIAGKCEESFDLLCRAVPDLAAECLKLGLRSLRQIMVCLISSDLCTRCSCYGWFPLVLRFARVSLFDVNVCTAVLQEVSIASIANSCGGSVSWDKDLLHYALKRLTNLENASIHMERVRSDLSHLLPVSSEGLHSLASFATPNTTFPDHGKLAAVLLEASIKFNFEAVIEEGLALFAKLNSGTLYRVLIAHFPIQLTARFILQTWFFGVLPNDEIIRITDVNRNCGQVKVSEALADTLAYIAKSLRSSEHRGGSRGAEGIAAACAARCLINETEAHEAPLHSHPSTG